MWALHVVSQSYSRCDNIKAMLNAMFPGLIPEPFSLSSSKISHLISEAVGPYFKNPNIEDLKKSSPWFTIHFDKTTNKQMRKQLGNKISFGQKQIQLLVHHLKNAFNGSGYWCDACFKNIFS